MSDAFIPINSHYRITGGECPGQRLICIFEQVMHRPAIFQQMPDLIFTIADLGKIMGDPSDMNYLLPEHIETERLILRIFQEEDWKDLHHYYSDEKCTKYTIQRVLTEGETWRQMVGMVGHWQLRKFGMYALILKGSGRLIGFAGLTYPNDWPGPELQWSLIRAYWGKGYASEAVMAIKARIAQYLPELSLISIIHPCNANSQKLADNIGAFYEQEWLFKGETWFLYRHRRMCCPPGRHDL